VNDGSTDGTEEVLKKYAKKAPCAFKWFTQQNKGSYAARNLGIEMAKGEIICFIDDDCIADKHWIEKLVEGFTDGWVGGVGGQIVAYNPKTVLEEYSKMDQERAVKYSSFLITANAAYRKDILKMVGGFDCLFRSGGDNDIGIRVTSRGYKLKYAPDAIVYHKHRATLKSLIKQRYNYGFWEAVLSKKYECSPIFMQFVVINLFRLFYTLILLPLRLFKENRNLLLLNIIVIFVYTLGLINGILFGKYSGKKERIEGDFLEDMKITNAIRKKLGV